MGLKAFREYFGVTGLVFIDFGSVMVHSASGDVLAQIYHASGKREFLASPTTSMSKEDCSLLNTLSRATPEDFKALFDAKDDIGETTKVFVLVPGDNAHMASHQVEVPEAGQVTVDGVLLLEGKFFTSFETAKAVLCSRCEAHLQEAQENFKRVEESYRLAASRVSSKNYALELAKNWQEFMA